MIDKLSGQLPVGYTKSITQLSEQSGAKPADKAKGANTTTPSAEVQLSNKAQFLQQATQSANSAPDVRTEVVQALQDKLEAGEYRVDRDRLVERLLPLFDKL